MQGGIDNRPPLFDVRYGKFNDQNRVFGGQCDQCHKPDLEVDIVFETAQENG